MSNGAMRYRFGEKIRSIREKKGMTMKDVGEKAGVTESLISQIERNKVSPAIDTLMAIVETLDIDLEYLFSDLKKERDVHLVKRGERTRHLYDKVVYEKLAHTKSGSQDHGLEAYYLEVMPGGEKGDREYGHVGKELGVVIEGKGEFTIGTKSYTLEEGDSISFSSDVPHVLKNSSKKILRAFWVLTPPKGLTE
jgi:transcriptional regulator with XRE-family HTH domain